MLIFCIPRALIIWFISIIGQVNDRKPLTLLRYCHITIIIVEILYPCNKVKQLGQNESTLDNVSFLYCLFIIHEWVSNFSLTEIVIHITISIQHISLHDSINSYIFINPILAHFRIDNHDDIKLIVFVHKSMKMQRTKLQKRNQVLDWKWIQCKPCFLMFHVSIQRHRHRCMFGFDMHSFSFYIIICRLFEWIWQRLMIKCLTTTTSFERHLHNHFSKKKKNGKTHKKWRMRLW